MKSTDPSRIEPHVHAAERLEPSEHVPDVVKLENHTRARRHDTAIDLELVSKRSSGYHMAPVTLSVSEARRLAALLQSAVTGG